MPPLIKKQLHYLAEAKMELSMVKYTDFKKRERAVG